MAEHRINLGCPVTIFSPANIRYLHILDTQVKLTENYENQGLNMPSRTAADISPNQWKQYRPFRAVTETRSTFNRAAEALAVASSIAMELKARFGASSVRLFGSLARGDFHNRSDIDLAVCGVKSADYFRAVAFASGFSNSFRVDLVDADDCSDALRQHIQQEGQEL